MLKIQLHYVPFGHMDIIRGFFFTYHILKKGTSLSHPSDSGTAAYVFSHVLQGGEFFRLRVIGTFCPQFIVCPS